MNLFEGNVGNAFLMDNYHGTGNLVTVFRNRLSGTEGTKTSNTIPVNLFGYNRFVNLVGNVLGTAGYHRTYEYSRASAVGSVERSIYVLGYPGVGASISASLPYDPLVVSTLLRWGNFDLATTQSAFKATEIPSGMTTPTSQALPPSLFLSARPAWWGSTPWPAIGPDVSGGADGAGHAHRIPAQACYEGSAKRPDGTLAFDPRACYPDAAPGATSVGSSTPNAPAKLRVR